MRFESGISNNKASDIKCRFAFDLTQHYNPKKLSYNDSQKCIGNATVNEWGTAKSELPTFQIAIEKAILQDWFTQITTQSVVTPGFEAALQLIPVPSTDEAEFRDRERKIEKEAQQSKATYFSKGNWWVGWALVLGLIGCGYLIYQKFAKK